MLAPKRSVKQLLETLEYGPAPEAPTVAEAWLDDHGWSLGHFIGNQWVKPEGRKTYDTFNPATGQRLASTIQGNAKAACCRITSVHISLWSPCWGSSYRGDSGSPYGGSSIAWRMTCVMTTP